MYFFENLGQSYGTYFHHNFVVKKQALKFQIYTWIANAALSTGTSIITICYNFTVVIGRNATCFKHFCYKKSSKFQTNAVQKYIGLGTR